LAAGSPPAWGEPVTTIRNNGDPANRVDLVILGDGYKKNELRKYREDVESIVIGFFAQEPFWEYNRYFNVHRVDVISEESGADHPERSPQVFVNTAFDATYNCSNIQQLICVNTSKVNTVLGNSVLPNQRDMKLVIVNDPEYGGSGGAIAVASTHSSVVELVLHELGHSFGLLADEYSTSPPTCNNTTEPPQPNVTRETAPSLIKWNVGGGPPTGWIEFDTPIPTISSWPPGVPGLYQGAKYCTTGLYRPTYESKMRSLGFPLEQINEEQFVKRFYNLVSPLDASAPVNSTLALQSGEVQIFTATVPSPETHLLMISWLVDGVQAALGAQFILDTATLNGGTHSVHVLVDDPTPKVRHDPAQVLTEQRNWSVAVLVEGAGSVPASADDPSTMPLMARQGPAGNIELEWGVSSCVGSDTDYEVYEGQIGDFTSHSLKLCSTGGDTNASFTPAPGSTYYIVVPRNGTREGSYGLRSDGTERPVGVDSCVAQQIATCG
jgi:hypothetical protein